MYTSFFPELRITRVDVEDDLFRVYCSIKTTNESEVPIWIEDEEFSNFISFFFFIWIEEIPDNFTGRRFSETFFENKAGSSYRLYDSTTVLLAVEREKRNILEIQHKVTMQDIKQQSLDFIEGLSITPEYGTTETLFQVEIPVPSSEFFFSDGQLTRELTTAATTTTNMIAYSHLDVEEFTSHYNITTGLDEIEKLGGNAIYQPLTNTTLGITTVSPGSENIVSYLNNTDSDPFVGFYDNDLFSTNRSPDIAPGLPDPLSWKHNTNTQSILMSLGKTFHEGTKNRKIKEASINSVKDGNSCKLSENCWITLNQNNRYYNYHFILDMYSIIKNHSSLGFLFNTVSSKTRKTGGNKVAFIESVVRKSLIKSMKVSRLRVENIPNTTNRSGNLIYENVQATETDPCVYTSDNTIDGQVRLLLFPNQGSPIVEDGEQSVNYDMTLEELNNDLDVSGLLVPKLARTFLLKDRHFFTKVTDGNYKYFIDLKIEDGFIKEIQNIMSNLKNAIKTVKLLLARVELSSHSENRQKDFSIFAAGYNEEELISSISVYVDNLAILNLVRDESFANIGNLKKEILELVSPKKLGNYENVNAFYKNLINLELQFLQILKSVGTSGDFELTIENSFSKNPKKNPSSKENNLISISIESEKTLKAFNKNAIFIDFNSLEPVIATDSPFLQTAFNPIRYITISEDDGLYEIANTFRASLARVSGELDTPVEGSLTPEEQAQVREELIVLEQILKNPDGGTFTSFQQQNKSISNLGNNIPGLSITLPRLAPPAEMISESDRNYGTFENSLIRASFELTSEQEFLHAASMGNDDIFQSLRAAAQEGELSKLLDSINSVRMASSYVGYTKTENLQAAKETDIESLNLRLFITNLTFDVYSIDYKSSSESVEYINQNDSQSPTSRQLITINAADRYNAYYEINGAIPVNTVRLTT